jgi:hypothetical protein
MGIRTLLLIFLSCWQSISIARSFQSKNTKLKDLLLAKVHSLPEVKEWFKTVKKSKPELVLNEPNAGSRYYGVQVGISNLGMFRTIYWLYINPKTFKIYYWDQLDSANSKVTLQQWRYWRGKPGWNKMHYYKAGKLVVLDK